ncbi:CrcB family protein [Saccharopolyspora oryzae]|uniref:Fluoride-specific ion channel FluC n=1 Tax=Saccharopolyspora oryzae TaxID=2997343 RepID=A0ABT4V8P5_9PSEU|nr:CrcB family protein [Saccharopolyspora oryzae]MDA3630336.1 CrcB family protein [Saccharopolyspora oryzae]
MGSAFPAELRRARKPRTLPPLDVLAVVAAGGALGSLLRYGAYLTWPGPFSTFLVNVIGCVAIGVLMFVITELVTAHRLVRPFLGVGVLGGFTTFSTYVADAVHLVAGGQPAFALVYLAGTVLSCLLAVAVGLLAARSAARAFGRG